ncbi:unnamed protein product [Acanthoscelides obtectus]|uniref:Uncharacterized protein n=1 Tax=Acanthoscelides obtectus TaxID=200917 RepID=A0A9P0L8T5_ACAOB|nr:unnamed protein product [Acanthoscelides obtectus]CAK1646885.1 hypothetical protein AOBTE_LOCUS14916 [Acanthoscelides obtectus]
MSLFHITDTIRFQCLRLYLIYQNKNLNKYNSILNFKSCRLPTYIIFK